MALRTVHLKHRVFIGLSGGYDSGAIALALHQLGVPFLAYNVRAREDMGFAPGGRVGLPTSDSGHAPAAPPGRPPGQVRTLAQMRFARRSPG